MLADWCPWRHEAFGLMAVTPPKTHEKHYQYWDRLEPRLDAVICLGRRLACWRRPSCHLIHRRMRCRRGRRGRSIKNRKRKRRGLCGVRCSATSYGNMRLEWTDSARSSLLPMEEGYLSSHESHDRIWLQDEVKHHVSWSAVLVIMHREASSPWPRWSWWCAVRPPYVFAYWLIRVWRPLLQLTIIATK